MDRCGFAASDSRQAERTPYARIAHLCGAVSVDHPDQVVVRETEGPEAVILELSVAEDDMGKVIGKQGRIAKAIRTVVSAATAKNSKPVFVEIHKPEDDEAQN